MIAGSGAGSPENTAPHCKKVLVVGAGGREHALAWCLSQDATIHEVLVAPGNAGTARAAKLRNCQVAATDIPALLALARDEAVDFTVVGPEGPLALGIVDAFQAAGHAIFGPSQLAAELEGSKAFSKDFLARFEIPTARYQVFEQIAPALAYVREMGAPIVVKADGLAAGKGVVVAMQLAEAEAAVHDMLGGGLSVEWGSNGPRIVIEEFLPGVEASYIVIASGEHFVALATSQDHKRVGEGDSGPNTGGMGAYSPAPVVSAELEAKIQREIIAPTLRGMREIGRPFTGFLYAGIMIAADGSVRVLEFNTRLGDPETQVILPRLKSDLLPVLQAAARGTLDSVAPLQWDARSALGVVLCAEGYPAAPRKGDVISGLSPNSGDASALVFHAGTRAHEQQILSDGGRVLCVVAHGDELKHAQQAAYAAAEGIQWAGRFMRRDIGWRAL